MRRGLSRLSTTALVALLVSAALICVPLTAQSALRMYGTLSGAAKAVAVDSTGRVRVALEGGGFSVGTGTATAGLSGGLKDCFSTTTAQTAANTTETDLWTCTVPANTLTTNLDTLYILAYGTFGANANNKTYALYFGAQLLSNSTTDNGASWKLEAWVQRTGASAQVGIFGAQNGSTVRSVVLKVPTENTANAITIKMTGTNGTASAGDIVFRGGLVNFTRPGV